MPFDRYLRSVSSEFIRDFTAFGNPVMLLILAAATLGLGMNLLRVLAGLVFIELVCAFIKLVYFKERPEKKEYANILEKIDAGSFPSVHTARSTFVFLALFFFTPGDVRFLFLALLLIIGPTRVLLKKHFISDMLGGYAVGILTFLLWLWIFRLWAP